MYLYLWRSRLMIRAIYPGSFDPVTFGHLDIITRSSKIVDELIIGVLMNKAKTPLFSVEERVKMLEEVTKDLGNVKVVPFDGLLVEFARQQKARLVIRGLRAITDFEYEIQMSQTNHKLEPEVETMFLTTNLKYSYLSSTIVREVAAFGGDISQFVPETVAKSIKEKMSQQVCDKKESAKLCAAVLSRLLKKLKSTLTAVSFSHYQLQRLS